MFTQKLKLCNIRMFEGQQKNKLSRMFFGFRNILRGPCFDITVRKWKVLVPRLPKCISEQWHRKNNKKNLWILDALKWLRQ